MKNGFGNMRVVLMLGEEEVSVWVDIRDRKRIEVNIGEGEEFGVLKGLDKFIDEAKELKR